MSLLSREREELLRTCLLMRKQPTTSTRDKRGSREGSKGEEGREQQRASLSLWFFPGLLVPSRENGRAAREDERSASFLSSVFVNPVSVCETKRTGVVGGCSSPLCLVLNSPLHAGVRNPVLAWMPRPGAVSRKHFLRKERCLLADGLDSGLRFKLIHLES